MTPLLARPPKVATVADLLARLGGIGPERVRLHPAPGTATVRDVIHIDGPEDGLFELVDGNPVEKARGYLEGLLAIAVAAALRAFVRPRKLGVVNGADGMVQLFPGLVRMPDVAFARWDRLPGNRVPTEPAPHVAPNLAVEVLSRGNTPAEMDRKRGEYFDAGVQLVWFIDPGARSAAGYTSRDDVTTLSESDALDGGDVLPGFRLSLAELFAEMDEDGPPTTS